MNREIKFRLWDNEERTMYNNNDIELFYFNPLKVGVIAVSGEMDEDGNITPYQYQKLLMDNFSLMQYTGLKDKNGKEIYEGDVIFNINNFHCVCGAGSFTDQNPTKRVVIFDQDRAEYTFDFVDQNMKGAGCSGISFMRGNEKHFEVIGNIYENPELLGKAVAE